MLQELLTDVIRKNTDPAVFEWLQQKSTNTFVLIPRKTGKKIITLTQEEINNINSARPGFTITNWSIDRLARVWLLLNLNHTDKEKYFRTIETLFSTGEMHELIALYSALPILKYPEIWKSRCAEGIRNNISDVLEAIMCNNPYPSENLDEPAWNQLVLKAFFTEKPIEQIIGLDKRANQKLASTLYDYVNERRSAHRSVDPQIWRCIEPFASDKSFNDIQRIKEYVLQ